MSLDFSAKMNTFAKGAALGTKSKTAVGKKTAESLKSATKYTPKSNFNVSTGLKFNRVSAQSNGTSRRELYGQANYNAARYTMNGVNRSYQRSVFSAPAFEPRVQSGVAATGGTTGMSAIQNFNQVMDIVNTTASGLFSFAQGGIQLADAIAQRKADKLSASQQLQAGMQGLRGAGGAPVSDSAAGSAISTMKSAADSSTLRQAIETGKDTLQSMSAEYGDEAKFNEKLKGAETKLSNAEAVVSDKEKAFETAENNANQKSDAVRVCETKCNSAKSQLSNAIINKDKQASVYANAHANNVSAQASLASAKAALDGANEETKPALQAAYDKAKAAADQAEKAEKEAGKALEAAKVDVAKLNEDVKTLADQLSEAQKGLDSAISKRDEAKAQCETAKQELAAAKEEQANAQKEVDVLKQGKKDYENLKKEIETQEKRLEKLEKEEQKKEKDLRDDAADIRDGIANRKIDGSDGLNLVEKVRQHKNERKDAKASVKEAEANKYTANNAKTEILKGKVEFTSANGEPMRSGLVQGEMVYFIGNREVSKEQYEAAKPKADGAA